MKNTRSSCRRLMLLILATICLLSPNAFGSDSPDLDLKLKLPKFNKFVVGDEEWFATDLSGFKDVLRIQTTYQTLGALHLDLIAQLELLDDEVMLLEESVGECKVTLQHSEDDREFVYKLRESDLSKAAAAAKRQKVRAILFGAGGGVVALAAGLLIGMFAI